MVYISSKLPIYSNPISDHVWFKFVNAMLTYKTAERERERERVRVRERENERE